MRIALLYNEPLPSKYHAMGEGAAISGVLESVDAIREVLVAAGHEVTVHGLIPPLSGAPSPIKQVEADLVFNLFEGFDGQPETEWKMAEELESRGRIFTGASSKVLTLCQDKARTKQALAVHGIPTPDYQLLCTDNLKSFQLGFPVIVKPVREDASHGLSCHSVVHNSDSLREQVTSMVGRYGSPALVESFVSGRDFNVAVLGGLAPMVLPATEIVYSPEMSGPQILTFEAKWLPEHPEYRSSLPVCPARVPADLLRKLEELALAAHQSVGSPPYARVDLRCNQQGQPYVLEVNPNPDLSPTAGLALQAKAAGLSYRQLIEAIVELAVSNSRRDEVFFRPMQTHEVTELVQITADTGFFRPDEVAVAEEVLSDAARLGEKSGYQVYVACSDGRLLGYVCFGPTPVTKGTWDMYWLAVAPSYQRRGIGRRLMLLAEQLIFEQGGRLIVLETSSQELYESTRRFHKSLGYRELAYIPDFYDAGDSKIIFGKGVDSQEPHRGPPSFSSLPIFGPEPGI
jgi:D-alanine-D-alanine ligase